MNNREKLKKLLISIIFFFLQVVVPISLVGRLAPNVPIWIVQFACYWGFTYLLLMLWFNRSSANRISLLTFLLFLVLSPMKLISFEGSFMAAVSSIGVSVLSLMKGPGLVAFSMILALLMERNKKA